MRKTRVLACWLLIGGAGVAGAAVHGDLPAWSAGGEPEPAAAAGAMKPAMGETNGRDFLLRERQRTRAALLPAAPAVPKVGAELSNPIDRFVLADWIDAELPEAASPPPLCDDATFARRVYLDVIGVAPTLAEADAFAGDERADKRERLIDGLLARHADYADHWTPFWEDAIGSTNTNNVGGIMGRGAYRAWLNRAFDENRAYDLLVAQLIDPTMPGRQPPQIAEANGRKTRTQFVMNETHTATLQTAAVVGQVFLGTAMKCASCHSHFENDEWPQKRFLAFAGMFSEKDLEVIRCEQHKGEFVPAKFPFAAEGAGGGEGTAVPAGEEARLAMAAELLVDPLNPRFSRTIVNRLWKRYVGLGFFEPADDFRLVREVSNQDLLDWLAHDLATHDFDLKRTVRMILTSRTYQQQYNAALEDHYDVARPDERRYFRSPTLRRLTAEQLLDSVAVVMRQELDPGDRVFRQSSSTALTRALGKPASRSEVSTGRSDEVAVVQGLELLNGEEFAGLVSAGVLVRRAAAAGSPEAAADELVRAAFGRHATSAEKSLLGGYLRADWNTAPSQARREVVWIDDDLPAGTTPTDQWGWVGSEVVTPASGTRAHAQLSAHGEKSQHFFRGAKPMLEVGAADVLWVEVFLDPKDPPREIMVQWNDGVEGAGSWEHRAYWGENLIGFGMNGTSSRRRMGPLPEAGKWVRLEIPAAEVGLGGAHGRVDGMSFDQAGDHGGGKVYWDRAGVVAVPESAVSRAVADVLWVLFTSPQFQYVW